MHRSQTRARWAGPSGRWALLVLVLAGLAGWLSRLTGRGAGGTMPGRVAMWLVPDMLRRLAVGRRTVLVSGTNGKSTTTRLLAAAAASRGAVVTNADGANLRSGLITALMRDRHGTATAVLEVDEVALPDVLAATGADVVVLLNLSRDQLDRVGEVAAHGTRWAAALGQAPHARVVANADDPLVVTAVRQARPTESDVVWVAAGAPWRADAALCPECGDAWDTAAAPWRCAACGLAAPAARWKQLDGHVVSTAGDCAPLRLGLPGRANAANALMAAAAADLLAIPLEVGLSGMRGVREVDGRYLSVVVAGKRVRLLLAKNPAGWQEALDQVAEIPGRVLVGVNARDADGVDPSWLWDVPFERLRGRDVVVFGECALDLSVRLFYGEVPHVVQPDIAAAIAAADTAELVVVANYTAFVRARSVVRSGAAAA